MKRYTYLFLIIIFALISCSQKAVSVDHNSRLDSLFDALSANNKMMGTVTIAKNGKIIYQRAVGIMNDEGGGTPAVIDTKYRIGSISKMFTSTMIFKLIEEKKLKLDTPLSDFFPEIKNSKKIIIENMLDHSSGLHNFTNDSNYLRYMGTTMSHAQILDIFASVEPDFQPGEKNEYSNTNYVLLGYIIEKITGKTYAEALKSMITDKADLKNTYYGGRIRPDKNEAASFTIDEESGKWEKQSETDLSIPGGAGSIVSTSGDLVKFLDALFCGRIVSKASLERMETIKKDYGAGMFAFPFGSKKSFGHNGGIDAFASMAAYFPEDSMAIAYVTNGLDYSFNEIGIGAVRLYYGEPYNIPTFKTIAVPQDILDAYAGVYASEQLPIPITVSRKGRSLIAQGKGQGEIHLEARSENIFVFKKAGIEMIFSRNNGSDSEFTLKQGGGTFLYKKQK